MRYFLLLVLLFASSYCTDFTKYFSWTKDGTCGVNVSGCLNCGSRYTESTCPSANCAWDSGRNKCTQKVISSDFQNCCDKVGDCGYKWLWVSNYCNDYSLCDSPDSFPCHMKPLPAVATALAALQAAGYMSGHTVPFANQNLFYSPSLISAMDINSAVSRTKGTNWNGVNTLKITKLKLTSLTSLTGLTGPTGLPTVLEAFPDLTDLEISPKTTATIGQIFAIVPKKNLKSLTIYGSNVNGSLANLNADSLGVLTSLSIVSTSVSGFFVNNSILSNLSVLDLSSNKLSGEITTDRLPTKFDLTNNFLYGNYASKDCSKLNNNCFAAIDNCTPSRRSDKSQCPCDFYNLKQSFCDGTLKTSKLCRFSNSICDDFFECSTFDKKNECQAKDVCKWCGNQCYEKTTACPACTSYSNSEKVCTAGVSVTLDGSDIHCEICTLGGIAKCVGHGFDCKCSSFSGPSCKDYANVCNYCATSGDCLQKPLACPVCETFDETQCGNHTSDCKLCESFGCLSKNVECPKKCEESTDEPACIGNNYCHWCGDSCVNRSSKCASCDSFKSKTTCDGKVDNDNDKCSWCGKECKSHVSDCPTCNTYNSDDICTNAQEPQGSCFWCGNGNCRSAEFKSCPDCSTYSSGCVNSVSPVNGSKCVFCPGQNVCNNDNSCNHPEADAINKVVALLTAAGISTTDYDSNAPATICYKFSDYVTCSSDYLHFDKITITKHTFTNLNALEGLSVRELDLSANQITSLTPFEKLDFSRLEVLNLKNNLIEGSIPSSLTPSKKLDLSFNQLDGEFPLVIFSTTTEIIIEQNLLTGFIGNCEYYKGNCFSDICNFSQLNPSCKCDLFATAKDVCQQISFCQYVDAERAETSEETEDSTTGFSYCLGKSLKEDSKFPTYIIVIVVVVVVVIVVVAIVAAIFLTRRKRSYKSSSSTVFEKEMDSKTGATVTF